MDERDYIALNKDLNKMNLQLPLIETWFRLTESLIKKEDYRNITSYWCNRFILVDGETKSKKWWDKRFTSFESVNNIKWILDNIAIGNFTFNSFDTNTMTLGYPKSTDTERIIKFEHAGIEIRTGNPEWGAEPNKLYFVIKHGKRI